MPWGGRGYRWMFWLTGLPGWLRFGYPGFYPGGQASWSWRCRWFPWLPRWWWTGVYGPVQWTPSGPILAQQAQARPVTSAISSIPSIPTNEIEILKQQKQALEQELMAIEEELKYIEERLKQLGEKA